MNKLNAKAFSLVETLVAAAVMSLSVVAIIAMIRSGETQVQLNRHRRTARGIVEHLYESPLYSSPHLYNGLVTGSVGPTPADTTIKGTSYTRAINIDATETVATYSGVTVKYRNAVFTISWTENAGATDSHAESVSVTKLLTNAQYTTP